MFVQRTGVAGSVESKAAAPITPTYQINYYYFGALGTKAPVSLIYRQTLPAYHTDFGCYKKRESGSQNPSL
jgi:hypothetical protein